MNTDNIIIWSSESSADAPPSDLRTANEIALLTDLRALSALSDEALSEQNVPKNIDLRGLKKWDILSWGIPSLGFFVATYRIVENDWTRLSLERIRSDGTLGSRYYCFIWVPKPDYRMYKADLHDGGFVVFLPKER